MLVTLVQKGKSQDKHVHLMASSHSSVTAGQQSPLGESCFEVSRRDRGCQAPLSRCERLFQGNPPPPELVTEVRQQCRSLRAMRYAPEMKMNITALVKGKCWKGLCTSSKGSQDGRETRGSHSVLYIYSVTISMPLNSPRDHHNCFFHSRETKYNYYREIFFNQKRFNLIKFMTLTWNSQETKNWMENKPNNTMNFI